MKKMFLSWFAVSGAATAAIVAFLLPAVKVDTVTGVTAFYTNASRTGWVYPTDNSYQSIFEVGVQKSIPIVYGGQGEADVVGWKQTPGLGGSFVPSISSISSYRWTPTVEGETSSVFRVYKSGDTGNFYEQTLYFLVVPEPGLTVLLAVLCAWMYRRA